MRVVSKQEDTYELLDLVSRRVEIVYVSLIYPFNFAATKVDPENVPIRDQGEFIGDKLVDSIIDEDFRKRRGRFGLYG